MLDEIEKWHRGFFPGCEEICTWRSVFGCVEFSLYMYEFGGLRVKNLRLLRVALRVRWECLRMTDLRRPCQGLPTLKDEMGFLQVWSRSLGKGNILFFRLDRLINGVGVDDQALEV
jgi:hypothetical protein